MKFAEFTSKGVITLDVIGKFMPELLSAIDPDYGVYRTKFNPRSLELCVQNGKLGSVIFTEQPNAEASKVRYITKENVSVSIPGDVLEKKIQQYAIEEAGKETKGTGIAKVTTITWHKAVTIPFKEGVLEPIEVLTVECAISFELNQEKSVNSKQNGTTSAVKEEESVLN